MKVSIIIPMYNVAQYLPKCISSVYNQGFAPDEFELIIVDDESPDDSLQIAKKLAVGINNATIISQKNKGLGGARNTGIDNARGTYVLFLDADDVLVANSLKNTLAYAQLNNLDVLEFGAEGVDQMGKIVYCYKNSSKKKVYNGVDYYQKIRYMDSACNKLYKRDFLNAYQLRFIEKIFIEDYEFNTRVFSLAKKVAATAKIVAHFLQTPNSITRNANLAKKEKMKQDILSVIKIIDKQRKAAAANKQTFFSQRLSYLTATLFYQLVKSKASYQDFLHLKNQMIADDIFFINFPIFDKKKNYFRIVFLKNFFLLKLIARK